MTRVFLIAGEVSGDIHGAELLAALPKHLGEIDVHGLGGPRMKRHAPQLTDWLDDAAVLGLWEVLKKYGYFKAKMDETIAEIERLRPDMTILIDYPGFNLRLAKALRQRGYRGRIAYLISPQVWAWKRGRIKEMARTLDLMMCIFPFEKALYEASGLRTEFVGHPLVDELAAEKLDVPGTPRSSASFPAAGAGKSKPFFPPWSRPPRSWARTGRGSAS